MIIATRKDGQPVQKGDFVIVVNASGKKYAGSITQICGTKRFPSLNNTLMQTYEIRTTDGERRPVLAAHIKHATPSKFPQRNRRRTSL